MTMWNNEETVYSGRREDGQFNKGGEGSKEINCSQVKANLLLWLLRQTFMLGTEEQILL